MDQRKLHLQNLGICYRLYHFITKTVASRALKVVTLGRCTRCSSTSTALRGSESKTDKVRRSEPPRKDGDGKEVLSTRGLFGDPISSPPSQAQEKNNPCVNVDEMGGETKARLPQTKSLKKSVSISDNVEEILPNKKMKKMRSKSFEKSGSFDQEEEEKPKRLRSILKVGSDLKDKSNPIC